MSVPTHTTPPPPIPQDVRDWIPATRTLLVGGSMVQPRGDREAPGPRLHAAD